MWAKRDSIFAMRETILRSLSYCQRISSYFSDVSGQAKFAGGLKQATRRTEYAAATPATAPIATSLGACRRKRSRLITIAQVVVVPFVAHDEDTVLFIPSNAPKFRKFPKSLAATLPGKRLAFRKAQVRKARLPSAARQASSSRAALHKPRAGCERWLRLPCGRTRWPCPCRQAFRMSGQSCIG